MNSGIHLRGPRRADAAVLADFMSNRGVVHGLSVTPFVSEFEVQRMLEAVDTRHWIVAEVEGRAAGFVALELGKGRWRSIASVALAVADTATRRGIGRRLLTEALAVGFGYLDLRKIELVVYVDNVSAIRLYESMGFTCEGTKRGNAIRDGMHVPAHVMSMLRGEWCSRGDRTKHSIIEGDTTVQDKA